VRVDIMCILCDAARDVVFSNDKPDRIFRPKEDEQPHTWYSAFDHEPQKDFLYCVVRTSKTRLRPLEVFAFMMFDMGKAKVPGRIYLCTDTEILPDTSSLVSKYQITVHTLPQKYASLMCCDCEIVEDYFQSEKNRILTSRHPRRSLLDNVLGRNLPPRYPPPLIERVPETRHTWAISNYLPDQ